MWLGYCWDQWGDLGLYCLFVLGLFIVIGVLSCYLTNKCFNKNKLNATIKKIHKGKKKWFYDVA